MSNKKIWIVTGAIALLLGVVLFSRQKQVDFSADVKPILNKKCISCHGGVKAKNGFSVLFREEALAKTKSGKPAIIPGDPDGSEMIRRLTLKDPEERMPYKHEPLSKDEIKILRAWIKQGAKWGDHWAYLAVKKTEIPDVADSWIKNDIDKFILQKLQEQKLTPSVEVDKPTLLRRVSLDLTGAYPNEKLAAEYLNSKDANGYEILVDSLLATPLFGERWASMWLDLARYADTKGYESDGGRNIWMYRDWVINAFNSDMPYDKFLTEQIAGDLLPNPDDAHFIATAFSRNSMTNDEGGTDNEEFRTAAVMDRVNTTWQGLMGTTFSCVQCHSHPYDPFKHDEYYKFMAYFNNTNDEDVPADYPLLKSYSDSQKLKLAAVTSWVASKSNEEEAKNVNLFLRTLQPLVYSTKADSLNLNAVIGNNNIALMFRNNGKARLKKVDLSNSNQLIFNLYCNNSGGMLVFRKDASNGPVLASVKLSANEKWRSESVSISTQNGVHDIFLSYTNPSLPDSSDIAVVFDRFHFVNELSGKGLPGYTAVVNNFWELYKADVPTTPIMMDNKGASSRKTFVFERGNRTTLGNEVQAAIPQSLSFAMPSNAPQNRLGLAMWLTDKRNPLVSRTIVNRLWEQTFGTGIVETLEDMGTQGIAPTHQQLLDYLSWKLMTDYKWSIKKMLKELVMSATYRQDSKLTDEMLQKDAANKFYARGPRIRLSAEQLRDQALCISGVMSNKMFGPPAMPWQPQGIWNSPYNGARWTNSSGEEMHRRAIYTYWKRTAPYPSFITFDGAERVVCTSRRIRTNTPLQALVVLNDSAYLDLAAHFASRMRNEAGNDVQKQIAKGYELMLFKPIDKEKHALLLQLYKQSFDNFKKNGKEAEALTGVTGEEAPSKAALVVVANTMLNLDEVIMKN